MIKFSVIHRARDGLALSASTDLDSEIIKLRESKRVAKALSRRARQFPVRCFITAGGYKIFCVTEADVSFLLISELNYQPVLAFSFLDDLKKQFLSRYTRGAVEKAIRPYSFIEFDSYILKTKQRYNNTRTLYTRIDLSATSEELKNNPPIEIFEQDLLQGVPLNRSPDVSFTSANVTPKAHSKAKFAHRLQPLTSLAFGSIIITGLCAILNVIRLVPFISQHQIEVGDEETHWASISLYFILSVFINLSQIYLLVYPITHRSILNWLLCITSFMMFYSLSDLRNFTQIAFHMVSSIFICYNIWKRPLVGKLPNYNV